MWRHSKLQKRDVHPFEMIPKEDSLHWWCFYLLGNWQKVAGKTPWYMAGNSDKFMSSGNRLVSLVVRRPPQEQKIPGSNPACAGIFSGSSHTSDLKIGTPEDTLPGAWRYRVSTGNGRPSVSILWQGEMESLICNFYLSVAARKLVWADPSLRYTYMLLGRWATSKQQQKPHQESDKQLSVWWVKTGRPWPMCFETWPLLSDTTSSLAPSSLTLPPHWSPPLWCYLLVGPLLSDTTSSLAPSSLTLPPRWPPPLWRYLLVGPLLFDTTSSLAPSSLTLPPHWPPPLWHCLLFGPLLSDTTSSLAPSSLTLPPHWAPSSLTLPPHWPPPLWHYLLVGPLLSYTTSSLAPSSLTLPPHWPPPLWHYLLVGPLLSDTTSSLAPSSLTLPPRWPPPLWHYLLVGPLLSDTTSSLA